MEAARICLCQSLLRSCVNVSRPRIAITCRYQIRTTPGGLEVPDISVDARFADLVIAGGGMPVLVPPVEECGVTDELMQTVDGLILSGGPDIPAHRYGQTPHPATVPMHPRREGADFRALQQAEARGIALLTICLGIQEWNVSRGGTLHQHVPDLPRPHRTAHRDGDGFAFHPVRMAEGSLLHRIVQANPLPVNSSHHQCIDRLGENLEPIAWAPDGIVEAVQDPRRPFALGLQWHPEDMPDDPLQRRIFAALVSAAGASRH